MVRFEDGIYLIEVSVDWDGRTEFGNCDPYDRVVYCKDCGNSVIDEDGNLVCMEFGKIMEDYEWCSRRVRRTDGSK